MSTMKHNSVMLNLFQHLVVKYKIPIPSTPPRVLGGARRDRMVINLVFTQPLQPTAIYNNLESQCKHCLFIGYGMSGDSPVVEPEDLSRQAQANTRSALFCSEERNEYLVKYFRQDPRTIIGYLHGNTTSFIIVRLQLNGRFFPVFQGMNRIPYEVDDHLFNQLLIG